MEDLGLKLKRAREERGVQLRDIAERTKISLAALEALERSEFHRLPGGIFSRSVVRLYAAEVGLDPDMTVEHFLAFSRRSEREQAERIAAAAVPASSDDRAFLERQERAHRALRIAVVIVAVAGMALLVWQVRRFWPGGDTAASEFAAAPAPSSPHAPEPVEAVAPTAPDPEEPAARERSPLPAVASPTAPATVASNPPATPPVARASTPDRSDVPVRSDAPARPEPSERSEAPASPVPEPPAAVESTPPVPVPAPFPKAAEPAPPRAAAASSPLTLELTARADCVISVVRDGGPVESQTLQSGGRLRLEAVRDVSLTVADAGAIVWRINGRAARPLGQPGLEVSVRVTPENAAEFLR